MRRFLFLLLLVACSDTAPAPPPAPVPQTGDPARFFGWAHTGRWEDEEWKTIVTVTEDGAEVAVDYEPEDGGPRVRPLLPDGEIPWPKDAELYDYTGDHMRWKGIHHGITQRPIPRPAVLLKAEPDTPWNRALCYTAGDRFSVHPRLYVGRPGAEPLPFLILPPGVDREIAMLGPAVSTNDLAARRHREGTLAVCVTREKGQVRVRWEHPVRGRRFVWDEGDVVMKGDSQPPGLVEFLGRRFEARPGKRHAVVFLKVAHEVRYADFLRVLVCARGDPAVMFWPLTPRWDHGHEPWLPPVVAPEHRRLLSEWDWHYRQKGFWFVSVNEGGEVEFAGEAFSAGDVARMLEPERSWRRKKGIRIGIVLCADHRSPWSACEEVVRLIRSFDGRIRIPFETEALGLGPWMRLDLPAAGPDALPLDLADAASALVRGRGVLLSGPDDAPSGEVLRAVLDLLARGATGVSFE